MPNFSCECGWLHKDVYQGFKCRCGREFNPELDQSNSEAQMNQPTEYKYTKTAAEPHLDIRETLEKLSKDKLIGFAIYMVGMASTWGNQSTWTPEDVFLDCFHNYIQMITTEDELDKNLNKLLSDLSALDNAKTEKE